MAGNILSKLLKDSSIYAVGDALSRVVAFCVFPFVANALSVSGFGLLELALTLVALGGVIARCGMNNAVQRFYWDPLTIKSARPNLVTIGLLIVVSLGLVLALLFYIFYPKVELFLNNAGLTSMGILGLMLLFPLTTWTQYIQDVIRLHFARWKFIGYSFFTRASSAVAAAVAAVVLNAGVDGVLLAQALVLLVSFPIGLFLIKQDLTMKIDRSWGGRLFTFGSPFILTEAAFWIFSSLDRWMLISMNSPNEVGLYSAAFRISVLVSFVTQAFGTAWSPYAVKLRSDYPMRFRQMYSELLNLLITILLFIGGGVALFSGELVAILLPVEFAAAAIPLAILTFCVIAQGSQQITAVGISLALKSHWFIYLVWMAAAINAALNLLLIPSFGASGAAWATLVSHIILTAGYLICSNMVYPIPYAIGKLLWLCIIGALLLCASIILQANEFSVVMSLVKFLILFLCMFMALPAIRLKTLMHGIDRK